MVGLGARRRTEAVFGMICSKTSQQLAVVGGRRSMLSGG